MELLRTVEATLTEVANAYKGRNASGVMTHFTDDARMVGNLSGEDWNRKGDWGPYLEWELERFVELDYRFLDPTDRSWARAEESDPVVAGTRKVALWGTFRDGRSFEYVGRWTYTLRQEEDGWKVIFSQFKLEA